MHARAADLPPVRQAVAQLNHRWRVIDDPLQWILEVRKGRPRLRASGYISQRFCVSRTGLLRSIRELCGDVDPAALEVIEVLPERHPRQKSNGHES